MVFKSNWEKKDEQFKLPSTIVQQAVTAFKSQARLASYEIISGGCANLNIKINLQEDAKPYILRVYLRDKDAAYREQKIAHLLQGLIPLPQVYCIGDCDEYRFAIAEYRSGITLRDLLLGNLPHNVGDIMYDVGVTLATFQRFRFPQSGFFDKDLNIAQAASQEGFISYVKESLQHQTVQQKLGKQLISKISFFLEKFGHLYPGEKDNHLVHADFDPANILVEKMHDKMNNQWKIAAILDWEFAFSGSMLCDMANMLRYAHHMPDMYERAFLQGLQESGVCLQKEWKKSVHMLNILSLLQCLEQCPPEERPNQCKDICESIAYIIDDLHSTC